MTDPRADALRSGYASIARAYREQLSGELAGKPLDRAFLDAFAERCADGIIIADRVTLIAEIAKWERRRNAENARIEWMFTGDRARQKLRRAYPAPATRQPRRLVKRAAMASRSTWRIVADILKCASI